MLEWEELEKFPLKFRGYMLLKKEGPVLSLMCL